MFVDKNYGLKICYCVYLVIMGIYDLFFIYYMYRNKV